MKSYQDLDVWRVSMDLVEEVYAVTRLLPKEEIYGLTSQVRRAAVSIPANIAEGYGRSATKEYLYFLNVALGSHAELTNLLLLCHRLHQMDISTTQPTSERVGQMLWRLRESISRTAKS